jgi:DNA-binding Xre family transcriptional regulator
MTRKKKPKSKLVKTLDGRLTPAMNIVCRLGEIMENRNVIGTQLSEMTGVSEDTITKLRNHTWQSVGRRILGRLAAALTVGVDELFVARPADIWFPIRRHKQVTVHFGSTSSRLLDGQPDATDASGGEEMLDRQFIGVWDHRAFAHVYNYLSRTSIGSIRYEFREHEIGSATDPFTRGDFKKGNHIVFGSPVVNPAAEHAVCSAKEITPRTPDRASEFPFNFRWRSRLTVSSFGARSESGALGIVDTRSQELIAQRTVVPVGEGHDCGLIMAYRTKPPERERRLGDENDDYIVIVIMGQSGCGTLASTQLLCDDENAPRSLYPLERDQAVFRVCSATYTRDPSFVGHDNRSVRHVALVENAR